MELEDFRRDFVQRSKASAQAGEDFTLPAFVRTAAEQLVDAGEMADFVECHYSGIGSRQRALRVDGYAFDDADDSIRLLVADWRGDEQVETLAQSDAEKVLGRVRAFVEDAMAGKLTHIEESTEAHELASELERRGKSISRFRIFLVTDCVLSTRVKGWPGDQISGVPVEFHIWDIGRFHRAFESTTGRDELEIDLTRYVPEGIPCLQAAAEASQYKAFLCIIPGGALAQLYQEYGSRLLEGNVRSFLSARGKVNKGIRQTIIEEPEMFFAFNNGIAATASEAQVTNGQSGLRLRWAKNLQIVNGGQTTASLATAARSDKADLGHVVVQMKLSVVPDDRSDEVIPRISRSANSQNKVSDADFFSNHPFHRRLEEISRRLWAPAVDGAQLETHWFYERARGQYVTEQVTKSKAEKGKFLAMNPREQLVTKTDVAKVENSWECLPHLVSRGAQKNFVSFAETITERWEKSADEFNEEYFKRVVARTILFRSAEKLVTDQDWYDGGYRANIVTYSIAKLSEMIRSREEKRELDFAAIWRRQALSPATLEQLAAIARRVFEVVTNPIDGIQNVTEWCKKKGCWDLVAATRLPLLPGFEDELLGLAAERAARRAGRRTQVVDNGIEAQKVVLELGKGYWEGLNSWARGRKLLSDTELGVLRVACAILPNRPPTEHQCTRLLEAKAKAEEAGFRLS